MLLVALFYYVPLCIWSYEVLNWYVGRDVASAGADIIRIMSAGAVLYLLFNLIEVNMYARGFALRVVPAYAVGVGVIVSLAPQLEAVLGLAGVATSLLLMQAAMFVVLATTFVFIRRAGKRSQPIPQVLP
jgi:uncharacterized membrane protein